MSARRAATVLVLRPGADAAEPIEVLLVRRHSRASFMANAYVFPGGAVDAADDLPGEHQACRRAALRELQEEVGLVLPVDLGAGQGEAALPRFARWLTPSAEPRRFDTDFYLALLPVGAAPVVDSREVFDLRWLTPSAALQQAEAGLLRLPPPTHFSLWDLRRLVRAVCESAEPGAAVLRLCQDRATPLLLPKLIAEEGSGAPLVVLPWDPAFASLPGEGDAVAAPVAGGAGGAADRAPLRYRVTAEGFLPVWG